MSMQGPKFVPNKVLDDEIVKQANEEANSQIATYVDAFCLEFEEASQHPADTFDYSEAK